jgi:hypothetical protein
LPGASVAPSSVSGNGIRSHFCVGKENILFISVAWVVVLRVGVVG